MLFIKRKQEEDAARIKAIHRQMEEERNSSKAVVTDNDIAGVISRSPLNMAIVSSSSGSFTSTGWKRLSRAASFSIYLR